MDGPLSKIAGEWSLLRIDSFQFDKQTAVSHYFCAFRKYYDDCAQILTEHILAAVRPEKNLGFSTVDPLLSNFEESSFSGFFRRITEKSKKESPTFDRSDSSIGGPNTATTLEEGAVPVRQIPGHLVSEPASLCASSNSSIDDLGKLPKMRRACSELTFGTHKEELRCVIAVVRHGDRTPKQKLKVKMTEELILQFFHKHCGAPTKDLKVKAKGPMTEFLVTVRAILANIDIGVVSTDKKTIYKLRHMRDILERWKITGLNRKLQIKPCKWKEDEETGLEQCTEVQLILKWGGNLTKLGEKQAISLGQRFRQDMYPDAPGGGILRLHSTFRHDLKIATSDEGRVMKTAAAFAKGLLELEGEIPPILVSLVHKEKGR
jgi:inositol hexakisphosphate/diphosphoinositol-pentakisphosphate kinase